MVEALFILFTFALEQRFMRFELKDIKDGCLEQELTCSVDDFPVLREMALGDDIRFDDQVLFQFRLQKSGQLVEVDGRFDTKVTLSCGRCLQPYSTDLRSDFALTFTPFEECDTEVGEEDEVELETDELGLVFYKDETLDLQLPLQDQLIMALPISPLCSDECAGLCPECGCNLNKEKCNCEKKIFNNKFSALAGLKVETKKN